MIFNIESTAMSQTAEKEAPAAQANGEQQVRLLMNQSDIKTSYANAFQSHHLKDEFILDLGVQLPVQDQENWWPSDFF